MDTFNKLYVAFTRAEEEMYIVGVYKKEHKEPTIFLPQDGYTPAPKPFVTASAIQIENVFKPFHHTTRKPLLVQAYDTVGAQETKRGEFVHRVFSRIEYIDGDMDAQVDAAIARVSREMPASLSHDEVRSSVQECLNDRTMHDLFIRKEERIVLREQELANRDGALYRADRIVLDAKTAAVIDFKTGGDESESDYVVQVRNYMEMLKEIYPEKVIRGYLAYVDLKKVRSVS